MPTITLPDGSQREYENAVSTYDVASDIGPGLAKACIAGRFSGRRVDAHDQLAEDGQLEIITARDEDGLEYSPFLRPLARARSETNLARS